VTIVEWAERLADAMPAERLDVLIDGAGDDPRRISIRPSAESYARYLEAVPATVEAAEIPAAGSPPAEARR
jgi:tRNA A37 threonylcarbamoyladenosine biosynthesis protein TsaE